MEKFDVDKVWAGLSKPKTSLISLNERRPPPKTNPTDSINKILLATIGILSTLIITLLLLAILAVVKNAQAVPATGLATFPAGQSPESSESSESSSLITTTTSSTTTSTSMVGTTTTTSTTTSSTTTTIRARYGSDVIPLCNNKLHPEWVHGVDCKYGSADYYIYSEDPCPW